VNVVALVVPAAVLLASLGAAGGESTRACRPQDYGVRLLVGKAHGGVALDVVVGGAAVPACRLADRVRLTVRRGPAVAAASWRPGRRLDFWAPPAHRWVLRSWCGPRRGVVVTVVSPAGSDRTKLRSPPPCRRGRTLVDAGARAVRPVPGGGIPAHLLPPGTPTPISGARMTTNNGWLVSNGITLVAVYAGANAGDPRVGTLGIIRQNLVLGFQTETFVDVPTAGSIRLTRVPSGATVETAAQHADLGFANSVTGGKLHLASDTVDFGP
jgi:hypothetical protein